MNRIERTERVGSDERPGRRARRSLGAVALIAGVSLASLVGIAPAPVAAAPSRPAAPAAPACSNGTYTVVRGDGWSIIARKLGVTTKALLAANGATTATVIHPGRSICVPAGATTTSTSTSTSSGSGSSSGTAAKPTSCANGTYTVVKGDGWLAIAKKVGATSKALLAANNATTSTALFPGRSVCLPAGATSSGSTAAGTTATVAVRAYTAAENEAIIRSVWPDELEEEALRIARRESNLKNNAKNSCCYGLFQIHWNAHKSWLAGIGVTSASQLLDPNVNTTAAYALYQRSGSFRPWAL